MKEFIMARVTRPITKRVRLYDAVTMKRLRQAFANHLKYLPSPFTTVRGEESFVAKVPVVMTTTPETPEVITIGREAFVRVQESPLTYRAAITRKARRR